MKIFYDFEYLDDGRVIEPISIGMIAEDGREYYAVFTAVGGGALHARICRHDWLMTYVVPQLPLAPGESLKRPNARFAGGFRIDRTHPDVKSATTIKAEVRKFLKDAQPVQLWGYYASHDYVLLTQLFGPMVQRPDVIPGFTHDIAQLCAQMGYPESRLPEPPESLHNALTDARWCRDAWTALQFAQRPS